MGTDRPASRRSPIGRLGWLLGFGTGVVILGQGAATPVLPEYMLGFDVGAVGLAWAVAAFSIGRLAVTIPVGLMEGRLPLRSTLTAGCAITALGVGGTGIVSTFWGVVVMRTVAGVGSGIFMMAAILAIVRNAPREVRAKGIGFNQTALVATTTVSPALGGYLASAVGLGPSFIVSGVLSVAGAGVVWVLLPWALRDGTGATPEPITSVSEDSDSSGVGLGGLPTIVLLQFVVVGLVNFVTFGSRAGARQTILPLIAVERFEMSVGTMGALFSMMAVVSLVVLQGASSLSDRLGRVRVIVPALVISAVGFALIPAAKEQTLLWVASGLTAVGTSLAGPAPAAWAADLAPSERQGLVLSSFRMAGDVGSVLAPLALSWVATLASLDVAMVVQAISMGVVALLVVIVGRRSRSRPDGPT